LETKLAELSKTYDTSEDSWRRALQAVEAGERAVRTKMGLSAIVAAILGVLTGYILCRLTP
jgi:hypothetical protein